MSYSSRVRRQRNTHTQEEGRKEGFFNKKHDTGADQKKSGFFQAKLTVNEPGDSYEKEADSVANDVVNKSSATPAVQQKKISSVQRLSTSSEDEKLATNDARMAKDKEIQEKPIQTKGSPPEKDKKEGIQKKEDPAKDEEDKMKGTSPVQKKQQGADTSSGGTQLSSRIEHSAGKGAPMSESTLHEMSTSFGKDFSNVKVHQDSEAVNMNKELQAQAFTHGNDIYFNSGKYDPESQEGKFLLAHELTHVVQQQQSDLPEVQCFPTTTVAKVRSLASEGFIASNVSGKWSQLRDKRDQRMDLINKRLSAVTAGSADHAILVKLHARWSALDSLLAPGSGFDPARGSMPSTMAADIALETADLAALSAKPNKWLIKAGQQFLDAVNQLTTSQTTVADEDVEMHRFDTLIDDPDVKTLVGAIRGASFTTAEIRAITGQETNDFTDIRVHGISSTKSGIRNKPKGKNPGHLGLGQQTPGAMTEAIAWASSKGVTIPVTPDPRLTPATSVKVTAAYLGKVADYLIGGMPATLPSGDEFKKMVFGAYKEGHNVVIKAAKSFVGTRGAVVYKWDDIKVHVTPPKVKSRIIPYVDGVVTRLS